MNYKFVSDAHVHSDNSYDALDPTIKLCEQATKIGLYSVTITDHCNCNEYVQRESRRAIRQAFFQVKKAQHVFQDLINVLTGIELGQPTHNLSAAFDALAQTDFDFVLAGIHKLRNSTVFSKVKFTNDNVNNILMRYFDEIIDLITWGNFDSLAHINYPLKFISQETQLHIDNNSISKKIQVITLELAKHKKALEIDDYMLTATPSSPLSVGSILSSFKKAGGKNITFGSNAHSYKNIGDGINLGLTAALKFGFSHFTLFKNRAPHLVPILS